MSLTSSLVSGLHRPFVICAYLEILYCIMGLNTHNIAFECRPVAALGGTGLTVLWIACVHRLRSLYGHSANSTPAASRVLCRSSWNVCCLVFLGRPLFLLPPSSTHRVAIVSNRPTTTKCKTELFVLEWLMSLWACLWSRSSIACDQYACRVAVTLNSTSCSRRDVGDLCLEFGDCIMDNVIRFRPPTSSRHVTG